MDSSCFHRAAATLLAVILEASCERGSEGELPFSQGEVDAAEDGGGGDDELELEDDEDVEAAAEEGAIGEGEKEMEGEKGGRKRGSEGENIGQRGLPPNFAGVGERTWRGGKRVSLNADFLKNNSGAITSVLEQLNRGKGRRVRSRNFAHSLPPSFRRWR